MAAIPLATLKDKGSLFGARYDWRSTLPNVKTQEYWGLSEHIRGDLWSLSHKRSPDGKYRRGGPFYSMKFRTFYRGDYIKVFRYNENRAFEGRFRPLYGNNLNYEFSNLYGKDVDYVNSAAYAYGAQAYASLRPDRPDFSPLLSLIELLREAPTYLELVTERRLRYRRELKRLRRKGIYPNKMGKRHLMNQFGLIPLFRDVANWLEAIANAQKRASQLLRDNGKWVRRRASLAVVGKDIPATNNYSLTGTTPYHPDMSPTLVTQCYNGGVYRTDQFTSRNITVWAVGKSKYFLPSDLVGSRKGLNKLVSKVQSNLDINAELVYNLIPWSWLVDYFFSLGSFFEALSGGIADRIVWDYAYVMRTESDVVDTVYTQWVYKSKTTTGKVTSTVKKEATLKTRVSASLFGFGVSEQDLSPSQVAIMGALGLSKLP